MQHLNVHLFSFAVCSAISKKSCKTILLQLECHFTWTLLKQDIDLDDLEERVVEQIEHLQSVSKVRNYNLLAYVKFLNGKKNEALENLEKAQEAVKIEYPEEIEKASLITWGNYAWVYYHMDKLTEVQTFIKNVESICKEDTNASSPYKMNLPHIYCEKGWALLKFGAKYYERAKENFAKALEEEPENPEFNSGFAITVYRLEKISSSQASSLEPLRHALRLNPNDAFVMPILALKLQGTGQATEGETYIIKALEKYPDLPYVLRYSAMFYRKNRDIAKSFRLLHKALNVTPNSGFLHHQLGICYRINLIEMKKKKYQPRQQEKEELINHCIFHFKKAVEHKTKFFYAYLDLANIYAEAKRHQEAEETFQKVFEMSWLTCVEKQQLHLRYGCYQEFQKKSESEAIEQYLEGLKIENDSFEREKCKCHLEKLIKLKINKGSGDAKSFGVLGFIHQLNGKTQEAINCYECAQKMDPANEEFLSALLELKLSLRR